MRALPFLPVPIALILWGCGPASVAPPQSAGTHALPAVPPAAALALVMGRDAPALVQLMGTPALDVREGPGRKLQFRGPACVLDAYLYPSAAGGSARVTWLDARTAAGADADRATCITALARH